MNKIIINVLRDVVEYHWTRWRCR